MSNLEKESEKISIEISRNIMAALSYLVGFVSGIIIFLFINKKNRFVRFHALQSIVTFGGLVIADWILSSIPGLGFFLHMLLRLIGLVLWVLLMVKALQGQDYKVPYIGKFVEEQIEKWK